MPLKAAKKYSEVILAPNDKVFERPSRNCLEFDISPSRKELVVKWIKKKYRITNTYSDQAGGLPSSPASGVVVENCRLKLERHSRGNSRQRGVSVGAKNSIGQTDQQSSGLKTSSILLGKGLHGTIRVGLERVFLTCMGRAGGGYNVSVSLDSPNSAISTSVYIRPAKKVNIGQVVENLNNKRSSVSLPSGAQVSKTTGENRFDYFLSVQ